MKRVRQYADTAMALFKKPRYRYHIEEIGLGYIAGWAYDRFHKTPCQVSIETTGRAVVAQGIAEIERGDLGGRRCGFRLTMGKDIVRLPPQRLLVFVQGTKVANCHIVAPIAESLVHSLIEQGREAFLALKTERLERELEHVTRRLGQMEEERALWVVGMESAESLRKTLAVKEQERDALEKEWEAREEQREALWAVRTERVERECEHATRRLGRVEEERAVLAVTLEKAAAHGRECESRLRRLSKEAEAQQGALARMEEGCDALVAIMTERIERELAHKRTPEVL